MATRFAEYRIVAGKTFQRDRLPRSETNGLGETVEEMIAMMMSSRWPKVANDTTFQYALVTCVRARSTQVGHH